jgi:hypothetical protein
MPIEAIDAIIPSLKVYYYEKEWYFDQFDFTGNPLKYQLSNKLY